MFDLSPFETFLTVVVILSIPVGQFATMRYGLSRVHIEIKEIKEILKKIPDSFMAVNTTLARHDERINSVEKWIESD